MRNTIDILDHFKAEIKLSTAGFPFITTPGRIFTSEDVRALEDENCTFGSGFAANAPP